MCILTHILKAHALREQRPLCVPDAADSIAQLLYFPALWFSVSHITRFTQQEALGQDASRRAQDQKEAGLLCVAALTLPVELWHTCSFRKADNV